jgi:hypothetical protein
MHKSRLALIAVLVCMPWTTLSAQFVSDSPQFTSPRLSAMGGMHAALADDITTLFSNPAGFRRAGPQLSVSEATIHLSGPVFSVADLIARLPGTDPLTLLGNPLLTNLYASALLNGPISFGYVGNGLGFGFFNSTGLTLTTQGTIPTLSAAAQENLMFVGGYSFSIPLPESFRSTLDLGVSIKLFAKGTVALSQDILSIVSLFSSGSTPSFVNQPFDLDVGLGVDAGVLYSWNKTISVGIVGRNIYAPVGRSAYSSVTDFGSKLPDVSYGLAPFDLSAGLMYSPTLVRWEPYITSMKIMLDYSDIFDFLMHPATASNPILHVGAGLEVVTLRILALRAGLGNGYFSAGMGINLTAFQLDFAVFGRELSLEPGIHPVYNLVLGLEFRY